MSFTWKRNWEWRYSDQNPIQVKEETCIVEEQVVKRIFKKRRREKMKVKR